MKAILWRILLVMVLLVGFPQLVGAAEPSTPSGVPLSQLEAQVDEVMSRYIGEQVPGAAVAIVKDGQIVFAKGYGYANIERQTPIDPATTYMEPGSVSKLFTWTAVMQLVEQGKLDLNRDIRDYLPTDYLQTLRFDEPITLLHLMNHMAGFEERVEGLMVSNSDDLLPLETFLGPGRQPQQIYRPGTTIAYSNFGTSLAGLIVQRVSGVPFEQYVQTHIFAPLGMEHSYFDPRYDQIPGVIEHRATGYAQGPEGWQALPNTYINDIPAGSMTSTATDMAHFMIAHMNVDGSAPYTLFANPSTLQTMQQVSFTHHPQMPGVAHGFWERFAGGHRVLEHGGNTDAFTALLSIVPEERFGIVTLTNMASEMAGLRIALLETLIGSTYTQPSAAPDLNHSAEVAGHYQSARMVDSTVLKALFVLTDSETVVRANADGSIQVQIPSMGIDRRYVETAPYLYERSTPDGAMLDFAGWDTSRLFFKTDAQGRVQGLSYGIISDELQRSLSSTTLFNQVVQGSVLITFVLGLLVGTALWVRSLWRRQPASTPVRLLTGLSLVGVLSMANVAVLVIRLGSNPFLFMETLTVQFLLFWLFGLIGAWLLFRIVRTWRSVPSVMYKLFSLLLLAASLAHATFLYSYNFLML
jgi:CubicO group peptidase (beta-lactamase class C family)